MCLVRILLKDFQVFQPYILKPQTIISLSLHFEPGVKINKE